MSSPVVATSTFRFLKPAPLVDRELHLVPPDVRWIDGLLAACHHPQTRAQDPEWYDTDRDDLLRLLRVAPGGHESGDAERTRVPTYHFWMKLHPLGNAAPPVPMAGVMSLRIGAGDDLVMYFGHFGYTVFPPARGRRYAERACRLLLPLARAHGIDPVWVTTDPLNTASRITCQRLGGVLVETVDVPQNHPLYARGQRKKCRYRIDL